MWARRLGCPPLWPSRFKVLIMSCLLCGGIFTFFNYLRNADVDYLDLAHPKAPGLVRCGLTQPLCRNKENPLACILYEHEALFGAVDLDSALPTTCSAMPETRTCVDLSLPLTAIQGDLGKLHIVNRMLHPLQSWAWLYLWLMILLWISMIVHDLSLLDDKCRMKILTMRSAKQEMPLLWDFISKLFCVATRRSLRSKSEYLWLILQPVWFVCQIGIFLMLVYPLSLFAAIFWWCPMGCVRVSRLLVFESAILSLIWSANFVVAIFMSPMIAGVDDYAVFWNSPEQAQGCVCYCEYPLTQSVIMSTFFFGLVACFFSGSIAFRSLKGLRRPNWGNLFSILYTVPIEAFPIQWVQPDGEPIRWRKAGEAVQSEPAFDPFCLMDEQPESGRTTVHFSPVSQSPEQVELWCRSKDPSADVEIGCCGFPLRKAFGSSKHRPLDEADEADDTEEYEAAVDRPKFLDIAPEVIGAPDVDPPLSSSTRSSCDYSQSASLDKDMRGVISPNASSSSSGRRNEDHLACPCGNVFAMDDNFCRKCGQRKPQQSIEERQRSRMQLRLVQLPNSPKIQRQSSYTQPDLDEVVLQSSRAQVEVEEQPPELEDGTIGTFAELEASSLSAEDDDKAAEASSAEERDLQKGQLTPCFQVQGDWSILRLAGFALRRP